VRLREFGIVWARLLAIVSCVAVALVLAGAAGSSSTARAPITVVVLGSGATVVSTPAGIACPRRCTATFASGTRVTLTPLLNKGFRLVRWAGSCKGSGRCTVRASSPTAVTAVFGRSSKAKPPVKPSRSVEAGYYSDSGGYLGFYVSPGRKIQNFTVYALNIMCSSPVTGAPGQEQGLFAIRQVAIKPDGSVSGTSTQNGAFAGLPAKITYSVTGHMTAATSTAAASGAGTFREVIVLQDSSKRTCTSNNQPWSAAKSGPIPQAKALLGPGKYSDSGGYFGFNVAGAKVLDLTVYALNISCLPALRGAPGQIQGQFAIPESAIAAGGSFAGKATQSGVFAGFPATITYSVGGNFQGRNARGSLTAVGTYREDIAVTDSAGTPHTCTSNAIPWSAAHT
jgi:hypothetical protein